MASFFNEIVTGRKIFIVAPDKVLFPENFLEDYLTLGYECYFIESDIIIPLATKVDVVLSIFKDSIIFFNIDAPLQSGSWEELISDTQKKYPDSLFGVFYTKRQTEIERKSLERKYLFEMGLQCGCIQLDYQKNTNFGLLVKILHANQAAGRRKNVRAVCNGSCTVKFRNQKNALVVSKLNDISLSHFTITIKEGTDFFVKDGQRVFDGQFYVKGLHFNSDAVLMMSRKTVGAVIYVFAFVTKENQPGLKLLDKQALIPRIYSIMQENFQMLMNEAYQRIRKEKHTRESTD